MAKKEKIYEYKKIRSEGVFHHLFRENSSENWKHHNPIGPAIEPVNKDNKKQKKEYYIFGIKHTLEEFKDYKQDQEGLPWFKQAAPKGTTHRH